MKRCCFVVFIVLLGTGALRGGEPVAPVLQRDAKAEFVFEGRFNRYLDVKARHLL